jgi:hypothetical protein
MSPPQLPTWARRPLPSNWTILTSGGVELDALAGAFSGGFLLIKKQGSSHTHILKYIGIGLTKSKGPLPLSYGGSYSLPEMPSQGWIEVPPAFDFIGVGPGSGNLTLDDFEGFGFMISGAFGRPGVPTYDPQLKQLQNYALAGTEVTMFVFGLFPPVAIGYTIGIQHMVPGVGGTVMPVYFSIGDDPNERAVD